MTTKGIWSPAHTGSARIGVVKDPNFLLLQGAVSQSHRRSPEGLRLWPTVVSCSFMYLFIDFPPSCLSSWNHVPNKPPAPKSLPWCLFWGQPKLRQAMSMRMCSEPMCVLLFYFVEVDCPRFPFWTPGNWITQIGGISCYGWKATPPIPTHLLSILTWLHWHHSTIPLSSSTWLLFIPKILVEEDKSHT